MADSPPGISAAPKDDNLRHFDVSVAGPGQSPYEGECEALGAQEVMVSECRRSPAAHLTCHFPSQRRRLKFEIVAGGIFKLELFLPEEYPMNPPKVRFLTKI